MARLFAAFVFALAYASQPLTLDACAVSCEAARAAQRPVVAAPCHHSSSCATQIAQPIAAAASVTAQAVAPTATVTTVELQPVALRTFTPRPPHALSSPPILLRL